MICELQGASQNSVRLQIRQIACTGHSRGTAANAEPQQALRANAGPQSTCHEPTSLSSCERCRCRFRARPNEYKQTQDYSRGRDNKNRENRPCIPSGMHSCEMHPTTIASSASRNQRKMRRAHPNPLCSTKRFWLPGSRSWGWPLLQSVALCSQTVARCLEKPNELQIVHKLLQSVAERENLLIRCLDRLRHSEWSFPWRWQARAVAASGATTKYVPKCLRHSLTS